MSLSVLIRNVTNSLSDNVELYFFSYNRDVLNKPLVTEALSFNFTEN